MPSDAIWEDRAKEVRNAVEDFWPPWFTAVEADDEWIVTFALPVYTPTRNPIKRAIAGFDTKDGAEGLAAELNTFVQCAIDEAQVGESPQPVSGGVEVAARELLGRIEAENATSVAATGDPLYAIDLEVIEHELDALNAALASSPNPEAAGESVVLEGQASNHVNDHDQKKYRTPYVCIEIGGDDYVEINTPELIERINDGHYKVTITPIKEN